MVTGEAIAWFWACLTVALLSALVMMLGLGWANGNRISVPWLLILSVGSAAAGLQTLRHARKAERELREDLYPFSQAARSAAAKEHNQQVEGGGWR